MGALELSCGGGPFGFDIAAATRVDYLIRQYNCDALIETGCHLGDTTEYLSRAYPDKPVLTCDTNKTYVDFVKRRVRHYSNVSVGLADSALFIAEIRDRYNFPFYYLDAHWDDRWPLRDELNAITCGVICIDDFDIGDPRFAFDKYAEEACDIQMIPEDLRDACFKGNEEGYLEFPCLQIGRRGGKCFLIKGSPIDLIKSSTLFTRLEQMA
jgi:hypothetical protein